MRGKRKTAKQIEYHNYLRTLEWKQKREEVLRRDNWTCQKCGVYKSKVLQVHHLYYSKTREEETIDQMVTLCSRCHNAEHNKPKPKITIHQKRRKSLEIRHKIALGYVKPEPKPKKPHRRHVEPSPEFSKAYLKAEIIA